MVGFKYGYAYERFAHTIKYDYRYSIDGEAEEFLTTVLATAKRRISILAEGTTVWRAQLGARTRVDRGASKRERSPSAVCRHKPADGDERS